jgi:hypothetical protein
MMKSTILSLFASLLVLTASPTAAQSGYQIVTVNDGGTITGTVKWSGPVPKMPTVAINKDVRSSVSKEAGSRAPDRRR